MEVREILPEFAIGFGAKIKCALRKVSWILNIPVDQQNSAHLHQLALTKSYPSPADQVEQVKTSTCRFLKLP